LVATFTYADLFSGIGGFHLAADALGGSCVFASDIDPEANRVYEANFGIRPRGDLTKIETSEIPDHDALFAGFPCQPFSIIGKGLGFEDARGSLFFEIIRILKGKKTKPRILILENVKRLMGHDGGETLRVISERLKRLGYKTHKAVLNALDFGLPQKRERVIIAGFLDNTASFTFPQGTGMGDLKDVLEPDEKVDPKYFASPEIIRKRLESHASEFDPGIWHENKNGAVKSHPFSCALRAGASYNYLLVNGKRRLTPREMLRLQGFPDSFKIVSNYTQTRRQIGNAVPVNLVREVLREALRAGNLALGRKSKS
jgi:DNA (cytosine-5)-methyltransferase 1